MLFGKTHQLIKDLRKQLQETTTQLTTNKKAKALMDEMSLSLEIYQEKLKLAEAEAEFELEKDKIVESMCNWGVGGGVPPVMTTEKDDDALS